MSPLSRLAQQVVDLQNRIAAGDLAYVLTEGEAALIRHALDRYREELAPLPLPARPARKKAKARAGT